MATAAASTRISLRLLQKTGLSILPCRNYYSSARVAAAAAAAAVAPSFIAASRRNHNNNAWQQRRHLSGFTFAGPRELQDVLKTELLDGKKATEIADLWFTYHETKDDVIGLVLNGHDGKSILSRAATCPYFVQPVFRDDGFFMLLSEFQPPHHFLLAYLQDYKMDPNSATPLLTFSLFDTYADSKDICLVRCDVLNKNINMEEGRKVVQSLLDNYRREVDFGAVKLFNQRPNAFDIDDHISRMNVRWSQDGSSSSSSSEGDSSSTITTP